MNGGSTIKAEVEFSEYQKEIEATENVILCVAKAEKMIREIGMSLIAEEFTANNKTSLPLHEPDRGSP